MPDYSYVLYDTAVFGVAAAVHTLFKVGENGDATHTSDFTNMRGSGGSIPAGETFEMRHVGVTPDEELAEADVSAWLRDSFIKVSVADMIVFQAPLYKVVENAGFAGHFTQAVAANRPLIGHEGKGYLFNPTVIIRGGVNFNVAISQGTALSAASQRIKCMLEGVLTLPAGTR